MSSDHVTLIAAVVGILLVLGIHYTASRNFSSDGHQRAERRERDWYSS
jgi:hypothetical protein